MKSMNNITTFYNNKFNNNDNKSKNSFQKDIDFNKKFHQNNKNKICDYRSLIKFDSNNLNSISKKFLETEISNNDYKSNEDINFIKKNTKRKENNDEKYVILIVDDHKFVRDSLKNIIEKIIKKLNIIDYFKVKEGQDGSDIINNIVLDQSKNNRIRCIITDENMEYINGSEAVKIIRNLEKNNKIKPVTIASITAFEDNSMKKLIHNNGIDYFLPKPCNENNLKKFFEENKIFEIQ